MDRGNLRTLHHDEEILNLEERLTSTVSDDPSRPELLFRLANALHTRFIRSKRPLEHDPAVDRLREALSLPQTTRSLYCIISNTLGSWLAKQARLAGNHLPMEEAIRIQRANLDRHKLDSPEYESALDGLSKVLHWSFILDEDRGKVEEAVRLQRERLKIRENEDNEEGITACLDSISTQLKSLLHVSPSDDPDRTQILADVGKVLWYQYRVSEDVMVLREAIDMEEQVLERLPTRHPNRPYALSQLRRWMAQYAMLTDGWTILDRAIDLGREAVKLCPSGHAHHANAMRELAVSLQAQADMTEEFAPLEEAILMLRGYLAVTPSSDVLGLDGGTGALVSALVLLSKMTKTPKHLEEAIQLEQGDKLGTGITKLRHDLSKLYIEQYQAEHKLELLEKAIQVEADAIHDSSVTAYVRVADIHASLSLVHYYALRLTPVESRARLLPRLLEVYAQALGLLPAVVDYGITNPSSSLAALRGLDDVGQASSALACALGQPARAVELLERARAVFWAQALRLRAPLDSLPLEDAEHLAEVFGEIELGSHRARNPELPEWADPEMDRLGALQMDATQLIEGVRERPGFEGFLMNRLIAELSMAAEKAPVVVLLAHEDACEALLITRPGVEIERVSLAKMPVTKLVRLAERVKATNLRARSMADASAQPEDDGEQERKAKVHKEVGESEQTLRAIWQEIVYPIILHLGLQKRSGRSRPRLYWCPTGLFAFLPLHAAGDVERHIWSSDFIVPSYTSTVTALLTARHHLQHVSHAELHALLVAESSAPGLASLPYAREEVRSISALLPPSQTTLIGSSSSGASVSDVLSLLPSASLVHLACHGEQDSHSPLESRFALRDGRLTVASLMRLNLPHALFAFLSACETAKGDARQPDQAVHLAAAMQFVGFRSVVATMWSMNDQDGPVVAQTVYQELVKGDLLDLEEVPYMLDLAVQKLRSKGLPPHRWAPYIHIGA